MNVEKMVSTDDRSFEDVARWFLRLVDSFRMALAFVYYAIAELRFDMSVVSAYPEAWDALPFVARQVVRVQYITPGLLALCVLLWMPEIRAAFDSWRERLR